ncbi:hypothetical protein [Aestuariimicrobium ganziense]|uniref:hypothetical protein n=1 Tax=Aestuariimicrobium ganziense TaxID=2773677 RepID=UPI001942C063|nr:hypothetical protein [Aestuariimicrobium ganziense]
MATRLVRRLAFAVMVVVALGGGFFAGGNAFSDWPAGVALAATAGWAVPVVALSLFARRDPNRALWVLVALGVLLVVVSVADGLARFIPSDQWGPVLPIAHLVLGVAVATLGLRRPMPAGALLMLLGLIRVIPWLFTRGGRPVAAALRTPSGLVAMLLMLTGALFMLAAALDHGHSGAQRANALPSEGTATSANRS